MVVIEPESTEEENSPVNVIPKLKSKSKPSPSPSETTVAAAESSHGTTSVPGDACDGLETTSESDFNDGGGGGGAADDDDDNDNEHKQQHQRPSVHPKDDSLEAASNDESTQRKALAAANDAKLEGNRLFGNEQYEEALSQYDHALQVAPDMPASVEIRSMCHANRALCFLKLGIYEDTIRDCTKALELNPNYLKALLRRGEAHEKLEHFEEAITDLKKVLELDQSDVQARRTIQRLEPLAAEKHERMKQEMIDKLKDMGNSVLGRFGMSIDNFKAVQDPKTGSYSISFQR